MLKIKTLFIGTSEFSVDCLKAMFEIKEIEVVGVITQPDKPAGRKKELKPTPVKVWLQKNNVHIPIYTPKSIKKEGLDIVKKLAPELIIVASYGQIIPKSILDYPKYKCLNVHASLLPLLRGAVPVQMAILLGFHETGITIQRMVYEMDRGPIIYQKKCMVETNETYETLLAKLSNLANLSLRECVVDWVNGSIEEVEQNDELATYCYISDVSKDKAQINFNTPVTLAERMVRAFYPWPVAWIMLKKQKRLKIFSCGIVKDFKKLNFPKTKELTLISKGEKLFLRLKDGVLDLGEIQLEGKTKKPASEYLFLSEFKLI